MNTELLKEAVGYAGWKIRDADPDYDPPDSFWAGDMFYAPNIGWYSFRKVPKGVIAALASQLIEQVERDKQFSVTELPMRTIVSSNDDDSYEHLLSELMGYDEPEADADGPNRNENSIRACVEFMRGRG